MNVIWISTLTKCIYESAKNVVTKLCKFGKLFSLQYFFLARLMAIDINNIRKAGLESMVVNSEFVRSVSFPYNTSFVDSCVHVAI